MSEGVGRERKKDRERRRKKEDTGRGYRPSHKEMLSIERDRRGITKRWRRRRQTSSVTECVCVGGGGDRERPKKTYWPST